MLFANRYFSYQVGCNPLDPEYGAGCNQGLDEVGNMFAMGNVAQCHHCSFSQDMFTGEELGDKGCRNPNQSGFEFTCPSYATASCFEAASFHEDYGASRNEFEEDYRGCSPFLTTNMQEEQRCAEHGYRKISSSFGLIESDIMIFRYGILLNKVYP